MESKSEKTAWLILVLGEVVFVVLTRIILAAYWTYSLDAELWRTPLRLVFAYLYWRLLRHLIDPRPLAGRAVRQPLLPVSLAVFLSVPLLVGDLSAMTRLARAVYAVTSIAVALKEELTYRALVQQLLARRFGAPMGILAATVLFTVYHIGAIPPVPFAYGQVVIASLLLGIIYARTRSLWLVIGLHALYDALWSLTPVLAAPLPYSFGLVLLAVSLAGVVWWGWKLKDC